MIQWRSNDYGHKKGSHEQTSGMQFRGRNSNLVGTLVMSRRGARNFKDYSEVRSEPQIDIWEASVLGEKPQE